MSGILLNPTYDYLNINGLVFFPKPKYLHYQTHPIFRKRNRV
jgi:hypothetical protein